MNDYLPIIRSQISRIKVPHTHDKVYKDECVYSFDSPFTDTGLFVNLITYHGVGQRYLHIDAKKTNARLYLHEKFQQIEIPKPQVKEEGEEGKEEITKLAIGIDGGFNLTKKYEIIEEYFLIILSENKEEILTSILLPNPNLPEYLSNVITEMIKHEGMKTILQVATWEADNEKFVSKYAKDLVQINPTNKKIPQDKKLWKDEASDSTENLWLNLSTGYIGGGRKNWDGTGGSGSALQHYIDTGRKYPLVVKLGTITPHGADVWSYANDEDCLVIDPFLAEHLSFWGIDLMKLEKTEKTLVELEVALNQSYDWSKIIEENESLEPVTGPGFIGLRNIGSSCYMNSLLQSVLSIPEFQERYFFRHQEIVQSAPNDPAADVTTQLSKVSFALFSDHYVPPAPSSVAKNQSNYKENSNDETLLEKYVIAPRMFKKALAPNHQEFSSGRQQDVSEYFTYFLDQLNRSERTNLPRLTYQTGKVPSTDLIFNFSLEIKYKELNGNGVKLLKKGPQTLFNLLELPVPTQKAIARNDSRSEGEQVNPELKRQRLEENKASPSDPLEAIYSEQLLIPFEACLDAYFEPDIVEFQHPVNQVKATFARHLRFQSFPRYLVVKLSRYYVAENWTQKKINAEVPMPLKLDLSQYRGRGLVAGEFELQEASGAPSANAAPSRQQFEIDENSLLQLTSMGFSENGCRRALLATQTNDVETATNWIFEHMEDPDFNSPPPAVPAASDNPISTASAIVNEESVQLLTSMGYTTEQCTAALIATDNNIERAADWLFSHVEDLDVAVAEVFGRGAGNSSSTGDESSGGSSVILDDGEGKYTLKAIISHIGKNTDHGHYVCHILKDGEWYFFNDEKVAKSAKPPLGFGFMYIYRRDDGPGTFFL